MRIKSNLGVPVTYSSSESEIKKKKFNNIQEMLLGKN